MNIRIYEREYMKTNKLRFIVFLLMFSLVAVACGGDTADDAAEAPDTTEAPKETLAAPATTAPPPEVIVVWAEEKVAEALNPLVGAYEAAAGVDVEVVIYDFGAIKNDVLTAGPAGEGPDLFVGPHDMVGEIVANGVVKCSNDDNSVLVITHYQRPLDYIVPDFVHILSDGSIIKSGGPELALEVEKNGYAGLINAA